MLEHIKYVIAKGMKIIFNPPAKNNCSISKKARVCARSELTNCSIDRYSYIGYQCFIVDTSIGSFCSIADRCSIGGAMHPMQYVSTSPVFHEGKNILNTTFSEHKMIETPKTTIENDVWIGQGAYVKAGITISTGAVIGMGAVVTHDVGPYEIWVGNPAKMIKKRFDEETIQELLKSKWWEYSEEELRKKAELFNRPLEFLKTNKEGYDL